MEVFKEIADRRFQDYFGWINDENEVAKWRFIFAKLTSKHCNSIRKFVIYDGALTCLDHNRINEKLKKHNYKEIQEMTILRDAIEILDRIYYELHKKYIDK